MNDDKAMAQRIARLTPGQLECLTLVNEHLSSKEIAERLGISPHTVDQRMRGALATLKVQRRTEAARMVAALGGFDEEQYQRLIHQSPHIEPDADAPQIDGAVSFQIRHADRAGGDGSHRPYTEQGQREYRPLLPLPFATRSRPQNEMQAGARLFWILAIAMGSIFSLGMFLAGLESLNRLVAG